MNKVKFFFFSNLHGQVNQSIITPGGADSTNSQDISPRKMDGVNVNNSAGVIPGELNTTNSPGMRASSLYCTNLSNHKGVKRVTQRVS